VRDGRPSPVEPREALIAVLLARALVDAASAGEVLSGSMLEDVLR
jgi:hypothetical protein